MKYTVDVIVPCFNGAQFLHQAIGSICKQNYEVSKIVIVDDGSTDESLALAHKLAKSDARIHVINQSNTGLASARNAGLRYSDGDLVAFLDCDDLWGPGKIERQVNALINDPTAIAVASRFSNFGTKNQKSSTPLRITTRFAYTVKNLLSAYTFIPGSASSVMMRRTEATKNIYFDTNLTYAEDLDFWLNLSKIGNWHIINSPTNDVQIRTHGSSMQSTVHIRGSEFFDNYLKILEKHRSQLSPLRHITLRGYYAAIFMKMRIQNRSNVREISDTWKLMENSLKNQTSVYRFPKANLMFSIFLGVFFGLRRKILLLIIYS